MIEKASIGLFKKLPLECKGEEASIGPLIEASIGEEASIKTIVHKLS